jgi:hypothetical protein
MLDARIRSGVFGWSAPGTRAAVRILTWPVHGNYMWYLSLTGHEFFLPVTRHKALPGYGGRGDEFPFPATVHDVAVEDVPDLDLDSVIFQSHDQWRTQQYDVLTEPQRRLPRVFIEHDPPRLVPTDTRHPVTDPDVLLVHVTHFNELMWDNGKQPTTVIEHGVVVPDGVRYTGEMARGIVVVNDLARRGRRLGADVFERVRREIPLDLIGLGADESGGIGALHPLDVATCMARYRFFFNPIRYTSLGLAVCEAMSVGLPVVGLATTEMVTVIENDVSGYLDTNIDTLVERMRELLDHPELAHRLGQGARRVARERFAIDRFIRDWNRVLAEVVGTPALSALSGP